MTAQGNPAPIEDRLRAIQSITDAALSRLDDRDLLAELMDRTREALRADTAAVLMLDSPSGQLIATAAAGLEEEVRQGVRIPVGRGFAGRIAADRRAVILDHVDHTTVLNPILWSKGIRSMMGVPMVAGGQRHRRAACRLAHPPPVHQPRRRAAATGRRPRRGGRAVDHRPGRPGRGGRAAAQPGSFRAPGRARSGDGRAGTSPAAAPWAATGTTCSPCRRGSCAW